MAKSVNKVILLGVLGRDAETKFTPSGTAVTNFSVATSQSYKKDNEWMEKTSWTNVVLWGAEKLASYLTKGSKVYLEGRLETRSYEDKNGDKKYVTEVIADSQSVVLCNSKPVGEDNNGYRGGVSQADGYADDGDAPF